MRRAAPRAEGGTALPSEQGLSRREAAIIAGLFVASRLTLHVAGLPFVFSLDWMWLGDPADLEHRLLQTVYYFHAFPPGMSLLSGLLLKAGGAEASTLAQLVFWGSGLMLAWSLGYLLRAVGLPFRAALPVVLAFSCLPQTLYFEHLYLYETPVAALLCSSVALCHAALVRGSSRLWLGFFAVCALICLTRATFHLAWLGLMLAVALAFGRPRSARTVLAASAVPATLLLALYVKNFVVFGVFGALTFGPAAYANVTVSRLPAAELAAWVREDQVSPAAAISPYAGPRAYLAAFGGAGPRRAWPPQITRLERPSVHAPNFNHWTILAANRRRGADAWRYVTAEPLAYAGTVAHGLRDLFAPSTRWHPYADTSRSPHVGHRRLLGGYEDLVNRVVHGFPVAPVGLYAFLPFAMVWSGVVGRRLWRTGDPAARARAAVLGLCLVNVGYVVAVSSALTFLESSRYRFQIESLIWVMAAMTMSALVVSAGSRRERAGGPEPGPGRDQGPSGVGAT